MKKLPLILTSLLVSTVLAVGFTACKKSDPADDTPCTHAYTAENVCSLCGDEWKFTSGLKYTLDAATDTYFVAENDSVSGKVVLPYGYNGKFVTAVGERAFYTCYSLESVTLPESVTAIGAYAFMSCNKLASVNLPDGLTAIGTYAFFGCFTLTDLAIGSHVKTIDTYAFFGCYGLENVALSEGITTIGGYAFSGCKNIESITIPASVTTIGSYAFYSCNKLTSAVFKTTSGWSAGETELASDVLATPSTAASHLRTSYYNVPWTRS